MYVKSKLKKVYSRGWRRQPTVMDPIHPELGSGEEESCSYCKLTQSIRVVGGQDLENPVCQGPTEYSGYVVAWFDPAKAHQVLHPV